MEYQIINPVVIETSMMNNLEMIKQFVELYIQQCPLDFEELKKSIETRDSLKISAAAHHIKPTMEYIGARDLRIDFQELETLGKENAPYELIFGKFKEITVKFTDMLSELNIYIKTLT